MHGMRGIVALGVALVAIAAGCGGDEGSEGPTGEEIVAQAADAFASTKSFHLVYDLENAPPAGSGLRLTHANGDVEVSNGEQRAIGLAVAGTFSGIPLESELVIVEGDGFLKDPLTGALARARRHAGARRLLRPARRSARGAALGSGTRAGG